MSSERIIIYTDGGSRGNPGLAAAGYILTDKQGRQLAAKGLFLGQATNNVAEYTAVIKSLEESKELGAKTVCLFSDSEFLEAQQQTAVSGNSFGNTFIGSFT